MGADEDTAQTAERPPSMGESLRVAWNVRSLRRILYALPFLIGPALAIVTLFALYYDEIFHVGPAGRGVISALQQMFAVAGLLLGSALASRLLRERPGRVITYGGTMGVVAGIAVAGVAASPWLLVAVAFGCVFSFATAILGPATQALLSMVIPARARGLGLALGLAAIIPGYIIFIIAGAIGDRYGLRGGVCVLVPVFLIGALIIASSGATVDADIRAATAAAMAAQISREAKERGEAKLLVCRDLDVHYGPVQVLFNVDFEVEEREIVALLGTNGAGKSTLLRAVSGLIAPSNGAIFYDGEDITYLPGHEHAARGIVPVPGGKGVFPLLTVAENLRLAAWMYREDDDYVGRAMAQVFEYFPVLQRRAGDAAGNLSGGEQQMLTLGQAFLSRPRLLMIDELSLGLAPAIVEQLLGIVRAIHDQGTTIILVEQSVNVALTVEDLRDLSEAEREDSTERFVAEETLQPFDLEHGPLLRARLLRLGEDAHILLVTVHHIIADGWSLGVLADELAQLYDACCAGAPSTLPDLSVQYADFAAWQREWRSHSELVEQLVYWRQQLRDPWPALELPTNRPRGAALSFQTGRHTLMLPRELVGALKRLGRDETGTLFMTLVAAFKILLHGYTGQQDLRVATLVANRNRLETERLIGLFVNTVILRTDLGGNPTCREVLRRVRAATLGAYARQDLPCEEVVRTLEQERGLERASLCQVMVILQNAVQRPVMRSAGTLRFVRADWNAPIPAAVATTFDMILMLRERPEGIAGTCIYKKDRFEPATVQGMVEDFERVLERLVEEPDCPLSAVRSFRMR